MWRHSRCLLYERQRRRTAIFDIVEERAPITVRVASAYALFVRERRQCARREPSGLLKGFGSFTSVKEEAEYASD